MYSTSELDELFQILNLIEKDLNLKGLEPHWSNTTWRSHQDVYTSREQVSCIYLVCGKYRQYLQSTNLYFRSCGALLK